MRHHMTQGFLDTIPLGIGVTIYGLVYGLMGRQGHLPLWVVLGMSLLVFAGSSQIVAAEMLISGAGPLAAMATVLIVNLRHIVLAADIAAYIPDATIPQKLRNAFFLTDESYAASSTHFRTQADPHQPGNAAYMWGCGLNIYTFWALSTLLGYLFGNLVPAAVQPAFGFAMAAAFLTMLLPILRDWPTVAAAVTAGVTAVVGDLCLPGKWYVLLAALTGSLTGFLCSEIRERKGAAA